MIEDKGYLRFLIADVEVPQVKNQIMMFCAIEKKIDSQNLMAIRF